jgi:hypothetical protein
MSGQAPPIVRAPARPSTRRGGWLVAAHVAVLGASYLYAPFVHDGPVVCLFRRVTGLPCPSCGLTRSFCAMSHGDLRSAGAYHPLGPLLFGLICASLVLLVVAPYRWHRVANARYTQWSLVALVLASWIVRGAALLVR